jgi:hypothetical protein
MSSVGGGGGGGARHIGLVISRLGKLKGGGFWELT